MRLGLRIRLYLRKMFTREQKIKPRYEYELYTRADIKKALDASAAAWEKNKPSLPEPRPMCDYYARRGKKMKPRKELDD